MIGRTDLFDLSGKRSCLAQDTDECETGGIDNSVVTLKKLTGLLCTSELSDIELAVGTRVFHVHKLILCMSSEVLRVMLTNPQWPEFYQRRIVLKEEPECVATFDKFLKYLYSGLAELTPESALPLLMLADKYSVTELSQLCVDYMCAKPVHAIRKGRIVSWLRYAHMCGYQELEGICHKMATWNFRQVTLATDFITMQKEVLLDFLKSSDLVIHDEYALYVAAKKWLLSHKGSFRPSDQQSGFKELIFQVLSHIKFPLISLQQFKLLQNDELAEEAKEFFQEKITLGMKYHYQSFEERQVFESSSKETEQFFPRNYTSETWNTTLTMENFGDFCERVMRLMYFSSPVTGSAADSNLLWEWQMEVYPKGVRFGKCMLIGLQENFIVPEEEYDTVRMAIKSETSERKRVELAVLVSADDGSVEYVRDVVTRQYLFDSDSQVCIMDDIISYQALNSTQEKSTYLCGQNKDTFKVMIVIKPLESR